MIHVSKIAQLRTAEQEARERAERAIDAIDQADESADLDALQAEAEEARAAYQQATERRERQERLEEARAAFPPPVEQPPAEQRQQVEQRTEVRVGEEPKTYRPDARHSYFGDLYKRWRHQDAGAAARLARHAQEIRVERRDLVTDDNDGSGEDFIPPLYLAELWADLPRAGRPFANAIGSRPLPSATGMSITLPRVTSGTSVAAQASEGTGISETDAATDTVTTAINTVAGMQDMSIQLLERSDPGMDQVIWSDLRAAYDVTTDTYLLSGSGSNNQHTGITTLSSTNGVTYTDGTPTAADLHPKIYDAIQQIATNRHRPATHIVMHPRRAAWLASQLSSTFPLVQQAGIGTQSAGTQNIGATMTYAGLPVVSDANILTTYGTGTNEDEVYVVHAPDLIFFEGPQRTDIFESPGSDTLMVRLRLFAYQAFVVGRYPKGISVISGTGLVTPTF